MPDYIASYSAAFFAVLLQLNAVSPANSQTVCLQQNAIYQSDDGVFRLIFKPMESDSVITSNTFDLIAESAEIKLDGAVIWNQGFSRPGGVIMNQCPEGDVTGEELDACILWRGVVYTLDDGVDLLPSGSEPAAMAILFPDLGRALHYSILRDEGKLKNGPWEVFKYSGCTKK